MSKLYYLFNKETLIINQTALTAQKRAGQDLYPRTALLTKPLEPKDGYQVLAVLDENGCAIDSEYVEDHREKTIYNTQNSKQSKQVEKLGSIEDGWTLSVPTSPNDEWIDGAWVLNADAAFNHEMDSLNAEYDRNMRALSNEYSVAVARDGTTEVDKVEVVRQKIVALDVKYETDQAALFGKYYGA